MNRTEAATGVDAMDRPLVCLVDTRDDGHHPMYAAVYARALHGLGCDVWLAAPGRLIAAMPPVEGWVAPAGVTAAGGSFQTKPWEPPATPDSGPIRSEYRASHHWESLGGFLDAASLAAGRYPDLVLLLWFDDFIAETLPRRVVEDRIRCPFAGLWFQPPPRRPRTWREAVKRLLRSGRRYPALRSRLCAGVLLLQASDAASLRRLGVSAIIEVPEVTGSRPPSVEPDLVTQIRRRAAGREIVSLVGSLEGRKGLRPFLEVAATATADDWLFVMAGRLQRNTVDPETLRLLDSLSSEPDPKVLLIDRWLDDETLDAIVACSSLLHVYYYDWPYSSNMICKAAAYDVPVIGGTKGYIGRMIRDYDLGFMVRGPSEFAGRFVPGFAAEVSAYAGSERFRDGCERYRAAHDPMVLQRVLATLLADRRLSCPDSGGCRTSGLQADPRSTRPHAS
mgnify:CR=1 FL=1